MFLYWSVRFVSNCNFWMPLWAINKWFIRLGFYYCFNTKDLQLSPSAKSSTSSPAKSFEVILAERKTPTLVHKPCQALYQCPFVKLIPISKPTPSNYHRLHLHICLLTLWLCEALHERNRRSERQIVNKSFACICGKKSGWNWWRGKSNLFFGNAASR